MREDHRFTPLLSFAVPVRDGERYLPRLLASIVAQDHTDFEVVVCDNCSTDQTAAIVDRYAQTDGRFRYVRNDHDIGQIANFNRALELSRGRYVRWIGCDDWLEPSYARRCIEVLEGAPHAIGVTTYQDHVTDDGTRLYAEYTGERLASPNPGLRFRRMLWFFDEDFLFIDPLYSMMRREAMLRTRRLLVVPAMDQVLAAELALLGPFLHIPECLAHRRKEYVWSDEVFRRYHPHRYRELDDLSRMAATCRTIWEPVTLMQLGRIERARCAMALGRFGAVMGRQWIIRSVSRRTRPLREALGPLRRRLRRGPAREPLGEPHARERAPVAEPDEVKAPGATPARVASAAR